MAECLRGRTDCEMLSSQPSDCGASFFCIGYNRKEDRKVYKDRFTACFKNSQIDERNFWDKRDLLDQIMVMSHACSTDENIKIAEGLTDAEMNDAELVGND